MHQCIPHTAGVPEVKQPVLRCQRVLLRVALLRLHIGSLATEKDSALEGQRIGLQYWNRSVHWCTLAVTQHSGVLVTRDNMCHHTAEA